jgi:hypothetical protein
MPSIEQLFQRYGPAYRWFATATTMVATISVVLSTTIVNVAIPDVMGAFGISQVQAHHADDRLGLQSLWTANKHDCRSHHLLSGVRAGRHGTR